MASDIKEDIAIIKNEIKNIAYSFGEFKEDQRKIVERLSAVETTQAKQGERLSNWNLFQVGFTSIIGAIATYLGYHK